MFKNLFSKPKSEWLEIAERDPIDLMDAVKELVINSDQNANVHQVTAYFVAGPYYKSFKKKYEKANKTFDWFIFIEELERISKKTTTDEASKRRCLWVIQAVLLKLIEDYEKEDNDLHDGLVEIWSHLLKCVFVVQGALENNLVWREEERARLYESSLEGFPSLLYSIRSFAPKNVQNSQDFQEKFKNYLDFSKTVESASSDDDNFVEY